MLNLGMAIARFRRPALAPSGPDFSTAQVGDEIGGGIYAGILSIGGIDHHIIAAKKEGHGSARIWKIAGTGDPGSQNYSDGLSNTNSLVASGIDDYPAAKYAVNYTAGGYTDRYLPARNELELIIVNLIGHPEFYYGGSLPYFWTSTEWSSNIGTVFYSRFYGDTPTFYNGSKENHNAMVIPVRRVAV